MSDASLPSSRRGFLSKIGELAARADIVVGLTPEDPTDDPFRGRREPSQSRRL